MAVPEGNPRIRIRIAHEDARTIVVNKMPGLVTEPGRGHRNETLLNGLFAVDNGRLASRLARLGEARDWGLLHRLDRLTSGLVLSALDPDAWDTLRAAFESRALTKTYLAIVRGELRDDAGTIDLALADRTDGDYRVSVVDPKGKPSLTHWKLRGRAGRYALVECDLVTGRLHQIRVHMASIGAPVAGDPIYAVGGRANTGGRGAKNPSLHLHAWKLAFPHPDDARAVSVVGEIPRNFAEFATSHGLAIPSN
ncbi:MAG: RluA family pseudouridine synthase [Phycisphaerae bacterium]|nr:RluA family pseudouridine synthase [Phycisphaerae bacterium]